MASGTHQSRLAVMLPLGWRDGPLRAEFMRGFKVGERTVEACGEALPRLDWYGLNPGESPATLLGSSRELQLVVAPPSADLRAFATLADQRDLSVVLPYQRGQSLNTLRSLEGRERLWPLVPSQKDDLEATVEAALEAGWSRAMVVADPTAIEAEASTPFVDLFKAAGGTVESYEPEPVQQVNPENHQQLGRFKKDVSWSWVPTVVVADSPDGALAQRLRQEQAKGRFGGGAPRNPNWIWLTSADGFNTLKPAPWKQLGLKHPARGRGWTSFQSLFLQRWGKPPTLLSASGYDTARLLALVDVAPLPLSVEGQRDAMGWIDPEASAVPLCDAFVRRRQGDGLRLEAAASDFRLRSGTTPSGEASVLLLE